MRKFTFGIAAIAALAAAPAFAGTTSGTMDVTLNVDNACSLTTAAIDFGTVTDFSAPRNVTSLTTLKCTPNAVATVQVTLGNSVNGTQRRMRNGAGTQFIDYNVQDGSGTAWPAAGLNFTGTGTDVSLGLRGVVPVQAAKPAGAYSDTVTINVTY